MKITTILCMAGASLMIAGVPAIAQPWQGTGNFLIGGEFLGSTNAAALVFKTNNTERARFLSTGEFGIGTTTPTADLEIGGTTINFNPTVGGTQITSGAIELTRPGSPGYPYIDFNDGTLGQDYDARILYTSNQGRDRLQVIGSEFSVDNSVLIGSFYSSTGNASAANSAFIENQLGVGYFNNTIGGTTYTAAINGNLYLNGTGTATGMWISSDMRWKKNIVTIDNALAKVLNLRGVTYDYQTEEHPDKNFPVGKQVGFIAQEVEKVVPEVVHTDGAGYKAVAYQNVTALLVEAMKQQQSQIDALRATVEQLQEQLAHGSGANASQSRLGMVNTPAAQ